MGRAKRKRQRANREARTEAELVAWLADMLIARHRVLLAEAGEGAACLRRL